MITLEMGPLVGGTKELYNVKKARWRREGEEGVMPRASYVWFKGAVVAIIFTWILSSCLLVTGRRRSKKSAAAAKQHHLLPNVVSNITAANHSAMQHLDHDNTDPAAGTY
jgi:hypothetical protein